MAPRLSRKRLMLAAVAGALVLIVGGGSYAVASFFQNYPPLTGCPTHSWYDSPIAHAHFLGNVTGTEPAADFAPVDGDVVSVTDRQGNVCGLWWKQGRYPGPHGWLVLEVSATGSMDETPPVALDSWRHP